jgi:hypothetical protein
VSEHRAHGAPDADQLTRLHEQAHRGGFIATSVKTEVRVCTA